MVDRRHRFARACDALVVVVVTFTAATARACVRIEIARACSTARRSRG
jgi:hypothetical protein